MRVKLDENLPVDLVPILAAFGHDVDSAVSEGLSGCGDEAVWLATQEAKRFLVTQDLDFADVRVFPPGAHCGLLVVRLSKGGRAALITRLEETFRDSDVESWAGGLIVLTDHKLRIRKS